MVSSSTPSRSAASLNTKRLIPKMSATPSSTSAPATMMSARVGSSPGVPRRSSDERFLASVSMIDCSSNTVNSKRLNVCNGVSSRAAWIIRAIVSAVPDEAMATSKPKSSTSRSNVARIERM